jgi:multiple sugar transport system ATP-binding protein
LARRPQVLLFDEPLSNLDAPLRVQLRGEIARLRRPGAVMILVTHDQAEALALADRVAVMKDGAVQQVAAPQELYNRPANRFVAGFIGAPPMNFFEGDLVERNGRLLFQERAGATPPFSLELNIADRLRERAGKAITLGLRPEHIVREAQGNGTGVVHALLERIEPVGAERVLYFSNGNHRFVVRGPEGMVPRATETVALRFETEHARFFDSVTGVKVEG